MDGNEQSSAAEGAPEEQTAGAAEGTEGAAPEAGENEAGEGEASAV